jgi:glycosyltransferase involved in cell wall biosynthesis
MSTAHPSISIGIPSYEAGESLNLTLSSIYEQTCFDAVKEIILVIDGRSLDHELAAVANPKLQVIALPHRRGQASGINTILERARGDWIILTNDDVLLAPRAIEQLMERARQGPFAVTAGHVQPLAPGSLLERWLHTGYKISRTIMRTWNAGDNYLACNGRLLALSREFAAELRLPEALWNSDAFIYLSAVIANKGFAAAEQAQCWFKNPSRLSEFLRQSAKFQDSVRDNQRYFARDIAAYFRVPTGVTLRAVAQVLRKRPLPTLAYLSLAGYARLRNAIVPHEPPARGFWPSDRSTKLRSSDRLARAQTSASRNRDSRR